MQDELQRIFSATQTRTQRDLAALLGVKEAEISDARRRGELPELWLNLLQQKFRLNPAWVTTGDGPMYQET